MRILVTGATGFVGAHLAAALAESHDVLGIAGENPSLPAFPTRRANLAEPNAARELLRGFPADVVLHAAAMSRVLECETQAVRAEQVNVGATEALAQKAAEIRARLFFFSSDMVFSGEKGHYTEEDMPSPRNIYGWTKWRAEKVVLAAGPKNLVVRLNLVVGKSRGFGTSFTERILQDLRTRGSAALFADQYRSPIHVCSVVSVVAKLIESEVSGLLHLGGPQRLSRAELGRALCRAAGITEKAIEECSYWSHPQWSLLPRDTSFGKGRRETQLPQLEIRRVEEELEMDFQSEGILT
ncbi:MAG: SDR family oxidoreductase, partial [Calditrichaeota bacterium]|nr:SDR family oxidoreductase [Calditrichota bacterium]